MITRLTPLAFALALAACQSGQTPLPGDPESHEPFAGIGDTETVRFTGTEPFWGGNAGEGMVHWSTPENPDGIDFAATRRAGRNGLSFSGTLDEAPFMLAITQQECNDGMSDRIYPFTATVKTGEQTLRGCAWSEDHPATGPAQP